MLLEAPIIQHKGGVSRKKVSNISYQHQVLQMMRKREQHRFIFLMLEEGQEIFEAVAGDDSTYDVAMQKLDQHFIVQKNVPYERSISLQAQQELGESMDQIIMRLQKMVTFCQHGDNKEDEIRDQVIHKCHLLKLRRRLLTEN